MTGSGTGNSSRQWFFPVSECSSSKLHGTVPSFWRQRTTPLHFAILTVGKEGVRPGTPVLCCVSGFLWPFVTGRRWSSLGAALHQHMWTGLSGGRSGKLWLSSCSLHYSQDIEHTINLYKTVWRNYALKVTFHILWTFEGLTKLLRSFNNLSSVN